MKDLLVMKFGGTSVGSAERLKAVAELCREQFHKRPLVVVVSAMAKVTDLLLNTLRHAAAGDRAGLEAGLRNLEERHVSTCQALLPRQQQSAAIEQIHALVAEFRRIANGMLMLREQPPRAVDAAVATGERLSVLLLSSYLQSIGLPAAAVSGEEVIVTDAVFGNASPLLELTRQKATARLLPLLEDGQLPIVTGFNGATTDGQPTTLGRGGSDYSASILAAVLDAAELWIWTDTDGILTADPRIVPDAAVLPEVTYDEAAELAYNGAKVLHPRTLAPLIERRIPVWIKNSFHPERHGTRIVGRLSIPGGPRAVTMLKNVALISIDAASGALNPTMVMARALETLASRHTEVLALSSSSYRQNFCFLIRREELARTVADLQATFALELTHGYLKPIEVDEKVGLLAVVGEGMRGTPGVAGRIFTAISRERINIIAIAQGSSELTIAIVVHQDGLEQAIRAVHRECEMARRAQEQLQMTSLGSQAV